MTDVHSHILPMLDDGAASVQMSIEMLKESKAKGIDTVVATSHCYLRTEKDIDEFLDKREKSYNLLMQAIKSCGEPLPQIRLGCEVRIENDVSGFNGLEKLKIEGTDYILTEMPFGKWNTSVYDALYSMTLKGMKPIMAHIERFFHHAKEFENLQDIDLIYQVNAESMNGVFSKKAVPYLFKNGMINLIGSDMHNTTTRKQCIGEAYDIIEKMYGGECCEYLKNNSELMLENKDIDCYGFKKLGFFERKKNK